MSDAPTVLIFFNRPAKLQSLWKVIEQVRPPVLILISDGPKSAGDVELVNSCRQIAQPTWNCEVIRIFREENVGLRENIVDGITAVFRQFEQAIVLEDDCKPHPSFFSYCRQLLDFYATDERIFSITGINQFSQKYRWQSSADYCFSRYFCTWGWAMWRRSWQLCNWSEVPDPRQLALPENGVDVDIAAYWRRFLEDRKRVKNIWGYQACLAALTQSKLTIVPRVSAIENIGLDSGDSFKHKIGKWKLPTAGEIPESLCHPANIEPDDQYDRLFERRHFDPNRLRSVLRRVTDSV